MATTSTEKTVRIGVIGGGLMGREVASAFGRWFALENFPVRAELVAVCDLQPALLDWFRQVPTVKLLTTDHRELVASPEVDVVYVAVPHHLHEPVYLDVLRAGKDLLAEKPFGIDLAAARRIRDEAVKLGRFVRVSSEFPFLPGAQRAFKLAQNGSLGRILEVRVAFLHSSDLDPTKPINWKRQTKFCGLAGVMNDLGLHVAHLPLRLGWKPVSVHAQLQKVYTTRPDGKGGTADSVADPQQLDLWLSVNGVTRQQGSTHTMIFSVAKIVHYLSQFMTLEPGDVISTGTPPGVGFGQKPPVYLQPGDVVELGISGLGSQRQLCRASL